MVKGVTKPLGLKCTGEFAVAKWILEEGAPGWEGSSCRWIEYRKLETA